MADLDGKVVGVILAAGKGARMYPFSERSPKPILQNVKLDVTDSGGILSHPAIIAREYRLPAVVATRNATRSLKDGQVVTVNGSDGIVSTGGI